MTKQFDGQAIAHQRIAAEARDRTGVLDLGQLGLTELPDAMFALTHLRRLHLGRRMMLRDGTWEFDWTNRDPPNWFGAFDRIAELRNLTVLSIGDLPCESIAFVASLTALQSLDCFGTRVTDLAPLASLTALQSLNCSGTQVTDLAPLASLTALQSLDCRYTQVTDLAPLASLTALQSLDCAGTRVTDLAPLASLTALQSLNCSETRVTDLAPLACLTALQSLDCLGTRVTDLAPLASLTALQSLDCRFTQVTDLAPLASLTALQSLHCSGTQVTDLAPLASLTALQSLDCSRTRVTDLAPLASLTALQSLDCSDCPKLIVPEAIWHLPALTKVVMHQTDIAGIPPEELSQSWDDNCLPSVRAYLRDRQADAEISTDVKLLILGNGRAGKTQLTRFLDNQPFEPNSKSTHGISIVDTTLPGARGQPDTKLHIWDFGGQDIYHGTHALFVRTRAIFLLVWSRTTEPPPPTVPYEGLIFRNYPLQYWAMHAAHFRGDDSLVLLVQSQCDEPEDEAPDFPLSPETRKALGRIREVRFSAKSHFRGHAELIASLHGAIAESRDKTGPVRVPAGRMRVRRRLEALRNLDGSMPENWRLMDQTTFKAWCKEAKGITSPEMFLRSLHNSGIVFYQDGLFDDRIVLDHGWALNAIYTVFDRTSCYARLLKSDGRFDRPRLQELAWQNYKIEEQKLFLGMMRSCGICFIYQRTRPWEEDDDTIYIAPDLLPERATVQTQIDARWDASPAQQSIVFTYDLLHPGLIRSVIARIGDNAGIDAIYWRGGVIVYETELRSHALIEHAIPEDSCTGTVTLQTKGGQARELLDRLAHWIEEENSRLGLRATTSHPLPPPDRDPDTKTNFGPQPAEDFDCFVSYAWGDTTPEGKQREAYVDQLCAEANRRDHKILRDKEAIGLGDRISEFMQRLGQGKRVYIILSNKYLQSRNCMFELLEIYRNSRQQPEEFLHRIKVYKLAEVHLHPQKARQTWQDWWDAQVQEDTQTIGGHLRKRKLHRIKNDMDGFINVSEIADDCLNMLALIADTLNANTWEDFLANGFNDPPTP
jgi:internalin A